MSKIVRATVITNSSEDTYARVRLQQEELWVKSELVCSVAGIPLKKGDKVFVDISAGIHNPIILGRATGDFNEYSKEIKGSLLFESSDGSNWALAYVKNNEFNLATSDGTEVNISSSGTVIKGSNITIQGSKVTIQGGSLITKGQVTPDPIQGGPFNCIPKCPFVGVDHSGNTVTNT